MAAAVETRERPKVAFWNDPNVRSIFFQVVLVLILLWLAYEIVHNTVLNLQRLNKDFGFGFLTRTSGFDIIQVLVDYSSSSTYGRALIVGFLNTVLISFLSIIAATIIGFIVGFMRLSKNWLASRIATVYIELFRNIPLLLWIFVFYSAIRQPLPDARQAFGLFGSFFLSKKGLMMPRPIFGEGAWIGLVAFIVAIVA